MRDFFFSCVSCAMSAVMSLEGSELIKKWGVSYQFLFFTILIRYFLPACLLAISGFNLRLCLSRSSFVGRLFVGRLFVGRLFVDRLFVDRLFVDRLFVDRLFVDRLFVDRLFVDRLFVDRLFVDRLFVDRLSTVDSAGQTRWSQAVRARF
uniref:Uncharacterized protein n=1 Tax=Ixodes scapularis TaxID=6945 RepID=A0A4D5RYZ4_IXOSC